MDLGRLKMRATELPPREGDGERLEAIDELYARMLFRRWMAKRRALQSGEAETAGRNPPGLDVREGPLIGCPAVTPGIIRKRGAM